jgi:hypothetical protein
MASIMGQAGDIFFPKLDEEHDMIPFEKITKDLLKYMGMEADVCISEEEARQKAMLINDRPKKYPAYFFHSDTSGEKPFEEFYTLDENPDMETFINLGVLKNAGNYTINEVNELLDQFQKLFNSEQLTKKAIVEILKEGIPTFEHLETDKGLDSKM